MMSKLFASVSYRSPLPAWVLGFVFMPLDQVILNIDAQGYQDLQMCPGRKLTFVLKFLLYFHVWLFGVFLVNKDMQIKVIY